MNKIPLKFFGKLAGNMLIELDEEVNDHLPHGTFSDFGGQIDETISSAMGKVQGRIIWGWKHVKPRPDGYDYPIIPLHHPLGQLAENICEVFEPYHGLRHIRWDAGIDIQALYPGIKDDVIEYLHDHGIDGVYT